MGVKNTERPIVENVIVADTFACRLYRIEIVGGGNARLIFTVDRTGFDLSAEQMPVVSLILPMEAAREAGLQMQLLNSCRPRLGMGMVPVEIADDG